MQDAGLPSHFKRKGYLSVTELTSPSWCEFAYQYAHLYTRTSSRTITSPEGRELTPSLQQIEASEKVKAQGTLIHAVLEAQALPPGPPVEVETLTKEDEWALRILGGWCNLRWLAQNGTVREFEVWGWIEGVFIRGVIDEIEQRPLEKSWSSQQEWKKDQQKRSVETSATLDKFGFSTPKEKEPEMGYFISDTKTRVMAWVPEEEDQRAARMQCMLYRRLLEHMCEGMDWSATFLHLGLDEDANLSDAFLAGAVALVESWGLDLLDRNLTTLPATASLLEEELGKLKGRIQPELSIVYTHQARFVKRGRPSSPRVLGSVTFASDTAALDSFLVDSLQMWRGSRLLRGVSEPESKRCWHCAWSSDCEWRSERATLHARRREEAELWSQLEDWDDEVLNAIL